MPGVHVYVDAPLAVKVVKLPLQMVTGPEVVTFGKAFTVTVPVTVYTVVETGLTVIAAVAGPVFHEYVDAPLAVIVPELPLQIVALVEVTLGKAFTVTVVLAVPVHPFASVPVTVYVVVVIGVTVTDEPF